MLKIASRNVNWLRAIAKKWNLFDYLEKENPDIVWLQETKAKPEQLDKGFFYKIEQQLGYKPYFHSAERWWYSWTAILTKIEPERIFKWFELIDKDILYKIYKDNYSYLDEQAIKDLVLDDKEWRIIWAEFDKFYFISTYVPNAKPDLSRLDIRQFWDRALLEYIKYLSKNKSVILCWDMNVAHQPIDLKYPKANEWKHGYTKEEREGFSNYLYNWFIDSFRFLYPDKVQYSWWSMRANARKNNSWWRIDYCLISPDLRDKLKDAFIHDQILGSDHAPVWIILDL